jgi:hypothetical protein
MPEGLKLVVTADLKQAQKGLKNFVTEAGASGQKAGAALGNGLNKVVPAIDKIPKAVKPAVQSISKLGQSLNSLKFAVLDRKEELIRTSDIKRAAVLNAEIKQLQKEIVRVQTTSAGGINLGGVGTAASKGFSALRQAAFILPGIGIAGILGAATDGLASLFAQAEKTESKIKDLIKATSSIKIEAAAGTAGEISKVQALAAVVLDQSKAYQTRNRALNELKEINKNYFGDLTLEASSLAKLTGLVNEYTGALIQQAVIKEFSEEIGKVSVAMAKQIPLIAHAGAELKKFQKRQQDVENASPKFGGLAAQANTDELNKSVSLVEKANSKFKEEGNTLNQLKSQFNDLRNALNAAVLESLKFKPLDDKGAAKTKADDIIAQAKRLAAFLDKNTQFEVIFEVDETKSEEVNKNAARAFIEKARSFIEKQTPEFKFKPLLRVDFKFINDGKFLQLIRDQAGIEATKTYKEVKREFEDNIKRLAENNPLIISTTAQIKAGIDQEKLRAQALASGTGIKLPDIGPLGTSVLTDMDKQALAAAQTLTGVLTPAFQGLFSAIKAGENPLKAFFDGIGQAVEQLIQKLIAAAVQALILSAIFPGGVGGVKGFGSIFKNILGFASGGIVSGPTLAMIGEGSGTSRSNPEIVAPLDQLRGILAGLAPQQESNGILTARIAGNDILLSNNRSNRRNGRLGA